jgi:hypothetical protein
VSAYRRKSQAHGRLLVWEKAELLMFKTSWIYVFSQKAYNLVTLQDNANIFDFVTHKKWPVFSVTFSVTFWFWKKNKRKTILNTKSWGKWKHNTKRNQNFNFSRHDAGGSCV